MRRGENKTRRLNRCQIWTSLLAPTLLATPLPSHYYFSTSHSCLIRNYINIGKKNSPLWCHEDLGMVVAHGGAILPGKVVDVVTLLVGEAGGRLKWDNEGT